MSGVARDRSGKGERTVAAWKERESLRYQIDSSVLIPQPVPQEKNRSEERQGRICWNKWRELDELLVVRAQRWVSDGGIAN